MSDVSTRDLVRWMWAHRGGALPARELLSVETFLRRAAAFGLRQQVTRSRGARSHERGDDPVYTMMAVDPRLPGAINKAFSS